MVPMKVVLEHTTGDLQGMFQILGDVEHLKTILSVGELPTLLPLTFPDGRQGHCSLVGVKRSFVFYRTLIEPDAGNKNFNPIQR